MDCGFTIKETERRMARLGVSPSDLSAILVTHEHSDHLSGVAPLARKYKLPVYLTPGTLRARDIGKLPRLHLIEGHQPFAVADIQVTPVAVPHDAREAAQFVFRNRGGSLGLLTDLGTVTPTSRLISATAMPWYWKPTTTRRCWPRDPIHRR
ncbi:MBL fold metallo-hydrolase [Microbulbifer taiwanensis]|uniref:MBL fold metallo-hydrolase n=1 Tax=Microbulbifer taiwanensis TaxID=986746 RepID=UPI0036086532